MHRTLCNQTQSISCLVSLALYALLISTCAVAKTADQAKGSCHFLSRSKQIKALHPTPSQIIIVKSIGGFSANITLCQRRGERWKPIFAQAFKAVVGKNGIAAAGQKQEGDLKTPAGLYPIKL